MVNLVPIATSTSWTNQPSHSGNRSAPTVLKQRFAMATRLVVFCILMLAITAIAVFPISEQLIFGVIVIMLLGNWPDRKSQYPRIPFKARRSASLCCGNNQALFRPHSSKQQAQLTGHDYGDQPSPAVAG